MTSPLIHTGAGFGLGLRAVHTADILAAPCAVDWFEVLSENYMVPGGRPLALLDQVRRDYPVAMHGVSLSIGSADGPCETYLQQMKRLMQRIEPMWVSDHLCWSGAGGQPLHDLLPLPYTDETVRLVARNVRRAQEVLGCRIVLENVCRYVTFADDRLTEWDFIAAVARESDSLILLDLNNVHVASVNHGIDPLEYLRGIPAERVQQIHLAGHRALDGCLLDTHDAPVAAPVWALYAEAVRQFGAVATMIERDEAIPPLADLVSELDQARRMQARALADRMKAARTVGTAGSIDRVLAERSAVAAEPAEPTASADTTTAQRSRLAIRQADFLAYVRGNDAPGTALATTIAPGHASRLTIYRDGYRYRMQGALISAFPKTRAWLGAARFDDIALRHLDACPSRDANLRWYGDGFAAWLAARHDDPLAAELAAFEWALGLAGDAADAPLLTTPELGRLVAARPAARLQLQPSVRQLPMRWNTVAVWQAIDVGEPAPAAIDHSSITVWLVWRRNLTPHFRPMDRGEAAALHAATEGGPPAGEWLLTWLNDMLLRSPDDQDATR